jgi:putative acetyltransferase
MEKDMITIREYSKEDAQELASLYYNTIHQINIRDYTQEQVDAWASPSGFKSHSGVEDWGKKFERTKPIIAVVGDKIVGFAEFEPDGHIDCFYCHHEWIGKGVGSALMREILKRAKQNRIHRIFSEVSITAKPFFERHHFVVTAEQIDYKKGIGLINFKMERTLASNFV